MELGRAVLRLKMRKYGDDVGLTAEVLKHAPAGNSANICCQCKNDIFCHGTMPRSWCSTFLNTLLKKNATNASC